MTRWRIIRYDILLDYLLNKNNWLDDFNKINNQISEKWQQNYYL